MLFALNSNRHRENWKKFSVTTSFSGTLCPNIMEGLFRNGIRRVFLRKMSFFDVPCCCKGVRGNSVLLIYFHFFQKCMSFFGPPCCGKRVRAKIISIFFGTTLINGRSRGLTDGGNFFQENLKKHTSFSAPPCPNIMGGYFRTAAINFFTAPYCTREWGQN